MKRGEDRFIQGIILVLCGNFLLWFLMFFLMAFVLRWFPGFGVWISRCVDIKKLPSPGTFGLARSFWIFSLMTGSMGFLQVFYVIPAIFLAKRRQQWEFMKGVILGALVTVLLVGNYFFSVVWCRVN